ncbi:hypothetical protein OESDEN_24912, partial [Oesophagostomum dentatum]
MLYHLSPRYLYTIPQPKGYLLPEALRLLTRVVYQFLLVSHDALFMIEILSGFEEEAFQLWLHTFLSYSFILQNCINN